MLTQKAQKYTEKKLTQKARKYTEIPLRSGGCFFLTQKARKYTEILLRREGSCFFTEKYSHRKHGDTQKIFCAVEGVVFFHGKHMKKLRRREVRGELTVWGDSGERDDVRWGWWGRVFHDGGGIVAPALGMTVGFEGAVGDVDDGVGVLAVFGEYDIGAVLGVKGWRYWRLAIYAIYFEDESPTADVVDLRRKNEVAAVGSTKCIVREISDGGRDRSSDATAYHDVRGRVDDGVAVVAAVEDRVVGAHGDSGELLASGKSVDG